MIPSVVSATGSISFPSVPMARVTVSPAMALATLIHTETSARWVPIQFGKICASSSRAVGAMDTWADPARNTMSDR
jgi:hypothetical protein